MAATTIYGRIVALTRAKFGHAVTPHLFRDSAATSVATEDPEHVYITKSILGHSSLKTSQRYYNHARSLEAVRRHQEGIMRLRRGGRDGLINRIPGRHGSMGATIGAGRHLRPRHKHGEH